MTSKNLYWAKWAENIKRRNWTVLLCMAGLFLMLPVGVTVSLTADKNRMAQMMANGVLPQDLEEMRERMLNGFAAWVGFSEWFVLVAGLFAVLFAVQGFSFLYSRRKMDLYRSVPVSTKKHYVLLWANGIIGFGSCYLINLLFALGAGAAFGVLKTAMLPQVFLAAAVNLLAYTAIYHVALVAVMLTGSVLAAVTGCAVLFCYEPLARLLRSSLKSWFLVSYCGMENQLFASLPMLTPWIGYQRFSDYVRYKGGFLTTAIWEDLPAQLLWLFAAGAAAGLGAYVLYRRRKTESYGQTVAFAGFKVVLEFVLVVPFSIGIALLFGENANDPNAILFGGALGGVLIGHALIRLIFERDLRAIVQGRVLFAASLVTVVGVLAVFRFDLFGYDTFLPETEEIATLSATLESDYGTSRYKLTGEGAVGYADGDTRKILQQAQTDDPATVEAVLSMVRTWQEQGMDYVRQRGSRMASLFGTEMATAETAVDTAVAVVTGAENARPPKEIWQDSRCWVVQYELKNGRTVYRRFFVSGEVTPEELNVVMKNDKWQQARYQLFSEEFEGLLNRMEIDWNDGVRTLLYTQDKQELLEAYQKDLAGYDYSLIAAEMPCGLLEFELDNSGTGYGKINWQYPVYESFAHTVALLEKNGLDTDRQAGFLAAEDVDEIVVTYWYDPQEPGENNLLEDPEIGEQVIEEQEIICHFNEPEEIRQILPALYPNDLAQYAGEEFRYVDRDTRFGYVSVVLSREGAGKRYRVPELFFLQEKTPDFVEKRIRESAVRG